MANHHVSLLVTIPFLLAIIMASPATVSAARSSPPPTAASPAAATANSSAPAAAVLDASPTPSAYDMLDQYSLARGILPQGVTGYVLRPDGSFEVYLPGDCNLHVGGMKVRYSSVVKGNIQKGSISDLEGVHVKELFMWIGITKVDAADGELHFVAAPISKSFPVDKFASSPWCD